MISEYLYPHPRPADIPITSCLGKKFITTAMTIIAKETITSKFNLKIAFKMVQAG